MNDSSVGSDRPLYLYILVLGNLIAVAGMAFLLLGVLGALGLITAVTDKLGGLGSSFASATTGSAATYSFAFLAGLLSLAASWKMLREGARLWLLGVVIVFQLASVAVFHSWVSVIAVIPTVAAFYGVGRILVAPTIDAELAARGGVAFGAVRAAASSRGSAGPGTTRPAGAQAGAAQSVSGSTQPEPAQASAESPALKQTVIARPAVVPAAKHCASCGAANIEEARFCSSCGSILPASS